MEKEIEEGNKLVAGFMGIKEIVPPYSIEEEFQMVVMTDGNIWHWEELQYHSSWDWLMPVVEKIGKMNYEFDISTHYGIEISQFPMQSIFAIDDDEELKKPLITQVWQAVVKLIRYNNQLNQ